MVSLIDSRGVVSNYRQLFLCDLSMEIAKVMSL